MIQWLSMNLSSILIGLGVLALCGLALRRVMLDRKAGRCVGCHQAGGCHGCPGNTQQTKDEH